MLLPSCLGVVPKSNLTLSSTLPPNLFVGSTSFNQCASSTSQVKLSKEQLLFKGIPNASPSLIPPIGVICNVKSAFEKLYVYTNHEDTGIRHALMDDEENYTPTAEEALFMLISCSAFINYLDQKVK